MAIQNGLHPKYLFFWGHTAGKGGQVGKECLSQWYPAEFGVDGVRYATAEHYMMAEKARLFGDEETREKIIAAAHPSLAKNLGREVQGFTQANWEQHRFDIVVRGNAAKFGQNPALKTFLLNTSTRILVEASPTDRIWGIGWSENDPQAKGDPDSGLPRGTRLADIPDDWVCPLCAVTKTARWSRRLIYHDSAAPPRPPAPPVPACAAP